MQNIIEKFKGIINTLKGMKFKQLALEHGEKVGLGIIAFFVLLCLSMTSWMGYARQPEELVGEAKKAEAQLLQNQWPDPQKKDFEVVKFDEIAKNQFSPVKEEIYAYDKPMSFKLYPREQPINEPVLLPVEDLIAREGKIVLALTMAPGGGLASSDEYGDKKTKDDEKEMSATKDADPADDPDEEKDSETAPRAKGNGGEAASPAAKPGAAKARAAGRSAADSNEEQEAPSKARGLRFVSVVGVIPFRMQMQKMMEAEHLESIGQAAEYIEYLDFKIERQSAISGKDPWTGPWKELNIQTAMDVLQESASFDPDVVSTEVTDPVFTMPLPQRVNGTWTDKLVSHPRLSAYLLSEEEKAKELALNQAIVELSDENGLQAAGAGTKKGFAKQLKDVRGLRSELSGKVSSQDVLKRANELGGGTATAARPGVPGMPGGMGDQGRGAAPAGHAKLILFRYLDFDVEPGECYRYRAQLILRNPNFEMGLDQVQEATVAQGETRTTKSSEPTPPVAVENDVEYFLAKVPRSNGRPKSEALIEVIQWDPKVGTLIDGTLSMFFGQFVGGKKKVPVLNVEKPSLEDKEATFSSKDLLVDNAGAPAVTASDAVSVHGDLNLSNKEWKELLEDGKLDQAVTVNPFGELEAHDAVSVKGEIQREKKRIDRERKDYKDLEAKEDKPATGIERLMGKASPAADKKGPNKTRQQNPLRAAGPRGAGAGAMPAIGPAGGQGGQQKPGKKR